MPLAGDGHLRLIGPPELINLAVSNEVLCLQDLLRREPVGGAALVVGPPLRRPPLRPDRRLRLLIRLGLLATGEEPEVDAGQEDEQAQDERTATHDGSP